MDHQIAGALPPGTTPNPPGPPWRGERREVPTPLPSSPAPPWDVAEEERRLQIPHGSTSSPRRPPPPRRARGGGHGGSRRPPPPRARWPELDSALPRRARRGLLSIRARAGRSRRGALGCGEERGRPAAAGLLRRVDDPEVGERGGEYGGERERRRERDEKYLGGAGGEKKQEE